MITIKVKRDYDYKLLSELNILTPKIPKLIAIQTGPDPMCVYTVDGMSSEDEVYFALKYNGTYYPTYD